MCYGLLRLLNQERNPEETRGRRETGDSGRAGIKKAHVVRWHSRGRLGLSGVSTGSCLAHWLTSDPWHAPPCARCRPSVLKLSHSTFIPPWRTQRGHADPIHMFTPRFFIPGRIVLSGVEDPDRGGESDRGCVPHPPHPPPQGLPTYIFFLNNNNHVITIKIIMF